MILEAKLGRLGAAMHASKPFDSLYDEFVETRAEIAGLKERGFGDKVFCLERQVDLDLLGNALIASTSSASAASVSSTEGGHVTARQSVGPSGTLGH